MTDYEVLNITPDATVQEIRAAYLKQVKKYHPDKFSSAECKREAGEKLNRINLAYSRLKSIMPETPCPKIKQRNKIYTAIDNMEIVVRV
ncbi:MAG: J domain-containing protein [Clostridia bacterium]|nr:J domain-containing protein [Clostridia bacterium]